MILFLNLHMFESNNLYIITSELINHIIAFFYIMYRKFISADNQNTCLNQLFFQSRYSPEATIGSNGLIGLRNLGNTVSAVHSNSTFIHSNNMSSNRPITNTRDCIYIKRSLENGMLAAYWYLRCYAVFTVTILFGQSLTCSNYPFLVLLAFITCILCWVSQKY